MLLVKIEGKKKGPGSMQEGALMKYFSEIKKARHGSSCCSVRIKYTGIQKWQHYIYKARWNGLQVAKKQEQKTNNSEMTICVLLALSSYCVMDVPKKHG